MMEMNNRKANELRQVRITGTDGETLEGELLD